MISLTNGYFFSVFGTKNQNIFYIILVFLGLNVVQNFKQIQ